MIKQRQTDRQITTATGTDTHTIPSLTSQGGTKWHTKRVIQKQKTHVHAKTHLIMINCKYAWGIEQFSKGW